VLVDPRQPDYAAYRGASLVKPNRAELLTALQRHPELMPVNPTDKALAQAAEQLRVKHQIGHVLLTLGEAGMVLCAPRSAPQFLPAYRREVFDVSGAGDTVLASFAASIAAGASYLEAAALRSASWAPRWLAPVNCWPRLRNKLALKVRAKSCP
jgi:D-beta-D-heptose 7-phosphate kinase / D-beta-D-heptose 1-phosphate adenosyltransferase